MRYNILTYLIGEGLSNVFRNTKQAFTSIGTMFLTMMIFGIFFIIGQNLNNMIETLENKQGIKVYMYQDATDEQIKDLEQKLLNMQYVHTVDFRSKEDALQDVKEKLQKEYNYNNDLINIIEDSKKEVLSVSYVVTLTDLSFAKQAEEDIKQIETVKKVENDDIFIDNFVKITKGIKGASYVIMICLMIFAVFIITNTIKLTVHARRKEISIMKYVGATNNFIRWPFAVEGMFIGLISGAISMGVLSIIYSLIVRNQGIIQLLDRILLKMLRFSEMFNSILVVYIILGIGVGALGSIISMRKYLKV